MEYRLYFSDLRPESQQRLLDAVGVSDPSEMNWDIDMCPLTILEFEEGEN